MRAESTNVVGEMLMRISLPLLWLDAATDHFIPQVRPELIASLSCQLAAGA
jgi:hypothetical protein